MITIMKTSTFLNAINDAYSKGVSAGTMAQMLTEHEDQNRRLEDMLHHGKRIGKNEGLEEGYRIGYKCGYEEGEADTKAEHGIIDIEELDEELSKEVFEEIGA